MSADNGIYILATRGPEYRVIEAMAIENIVYGVPSGQLNTSAVLDYFGNAEVFTQEDDAWQEARRLYKKICDIGWFTEYGICTLKFEHVDFPKVEWLNV